jgi:hypothetical protein
MDKKFSDLITLCFPLNLTVSMKRKAELYVYVVYDEEYEASLYNPP